MAMTVDPQASAATATPRRTSLEELARQQVVQPVTDPRNLLGTFWPEDETADDFLAAVRAIRKGEATDPA